MLAFGDDDFGCGTKAIVSSASVSPTNSAEEGGDDDNEPVLVVIVVAVAVAVAVVAVGMMWLSELR
mgnify:CR=1 FL=1